MARATLPGIEVTSLATNDDRPFWGTTESQWGTADVLVKASNVPEHPNVVVNEFICNRLATALGLPTPAGDIWQDSQGGFHWVSIELKKGGVTLPPPTTAILRSIPAFDRALIVYFDALIDNIDRTQENVLAASKGRYWLIDHDMALFGDDLPVDRADTLLRRINTPLAATFGTLAPEIFPDDGDQGRLDAMRRVKNLSGTAIAQAIEPLRWRRFLNSAEADAATRYLKARRDTIDTLVSSARHGVGSDVSGGLLDLLNWGEGDDHDD